MIKTAENIERQQKIINMENKKMNEENILTALISSSAEMSCVFREISKNFIADAVPTDKTTTASAVMSTSGSNG